MTGRRVLHWIVLFSVLQFLTGCLAQQLGFSNPPAEEPPQIDVLRSGGLANYRSFYIEPIEVYSTQGDYLQRIEDRDVQHLAIDFRSKLIRQLGDRYATIPQPGRNTAYVKIAITDVATTYALSQILPGMAVPNALRGGASIEATFLDSVSKEAVVHVRDSRQGQRQGYISGMRKWDGVERAFDEWAMLLGQATRR